MTGDEANDVTKALAALGGPAICYQSFGKPAVVVTTTSDVAVPAALPAPDPKIQPLVSPSEAVQTSIPLRHMPPAAMRTWPSPSGSNGAQPIAKPVDHVVAGAAPSAPAIIALPVVMASHPAELVPGPGPAPPATAMPQRIAPACAAAPSARPETGTRVAVPASPAFRSLAEVFHLLAERPAGIPLPARSRSELFRRS